MTVVGNSMILDLQDPTAKMSKSSPSGAVFIMDSNDQIMKKIKSAVTDSDREVSFDVAAKQGIANLIGMLAAATDVDINVTAAAVSGLGYGVFKQQVAEALVAWIEPVRTQAQQLLAEPAGLAQVIEAGAQRAKIVASKTITDTYERLGLLGSGSWDLDHKQNGAFLAAWTYQFLQSWLLLHQISNWSDNEKLHAFSRTRPDQRADASHWQVVVATICDICGTDLFFYLLHF